MAENNVTELMRDGAQEAKGFDPFGALMREMREAGIMGYTDGAAHENPLTTNPNVMSEQAEAHLSGLTVSEYRAGLEGKSVADWMVDNAKASGIEDPMSDPSFQRELYGVMSENAEAHGVDVVDYAEKQETFTQENMGEAWGQHGDVKVDHDRMNWSEREMSEDQAESESDEKETEDKEVNDKGKADEKSLGDEKGAEGKSLDDVLDDAKRETAEQFIDGEIDVDEMRDRLDGLETLEKTLKENEGDGKDDAKSAGDDERAMGGWEHDWSRYQNRPESPTEQLKQFQDWMNEVHDAHERGESTPFDTESIDKGSADKSASDKMPKFNAGIVSAMANLMGGAGVGSVAAAGFAANAMSKNNEFTSDRSAADILGKEYGGADGAEKDSAMPDLSFGTGGVAAGAAKDDVQMQA